MPDTTLNGEDAAISDDNCFPLQGAPCLPCTQTILSQPQGSVKDDRLGWGWGNEGD